MTHDYSGLYEAAMGAAPTLFIAYVLEYRYLVGENTRSVYARIVGILTLSALTAAFVVSVMQLFFEGHERVYANIVYLLLLWSVSSMFGTYLVTFIGDFPKKKKAKPVEKSDTDEEE